MAEFECIEMMGCFGVKLQYGCMENVTSMSMQRSKFKGYTIQVSLQWCWSGKEHDIMVSHAGE